MEETEKNKPTVFEALNQLNEALEAIGRAMELRSLTANMRNAISMSELDAIVGSSVQALKLSHEDLKNALVEG